MNTAIAIIWSMFCIGMIGLLGTVVFIAWTGELEYDEDDHHKDDDGPDDPPPGMRPA